MSRGSEKETTGGKLTDRGIQLNSGGGVKSQQWVKRVCTEEYMQLHRPRMRPNAAPMLMKAWASIEMAESGALWKHHLCSCSAQLLAPFRTQETPRLHWLGHVNAQVVHRRQEHFGGGGGFEYERTSNRTDSGMSGEIHTIINMVHSSDLYLKKGLSA